MIAWESVRLSVQAEKSNGMGADMRDRLLLLASIAASASLIAQPVSAANDVFNLDADICEGDYNAANSNPERDQIQKPNCSSSVEYETESFGTSIVGDLFDSIDPQGLAELARQGAQQAGQTFAQDESIFATVDYRGLPVRALFPNQGFVGAGSLFCISFKGVPNDTGRRANAACPSGSFAFGGGANQTRENAIDEFEAYYKSNEDGTASRVNQQLVRQSPNDPIAGNPTSMQSRAAASDFAQSFTQRVSQVWGCSTGASAREKLMLAKAGFGCVADVADANFRLPAIDVAQNDSTMSDAAQIGLYEDYFRRQQSDLTENKFGLGIEYAQVSATSGGTGKELDSSVLSLPLSYSFVFGGDARKKFIVRLPISMSKTEDATAYQAMLGLAYSHPVTDAWSLTPSFGYSVVGSEDLGSAGALLSYSISSSFTFDFAGWALNIGNTIGQYTSQKIKIGDYESDTDVSNTVFTNGLLLSGPNSLLSNSLVLEYFIYDTRFTGDDLFVDNSQEFGINIGKLNTTNEVVTSFIKGGISYARATGDNDNEADVLRLSLQFKF